MNNYPYQQMSLFQQPYQTSYQPTQYQAQVSQTGGIVWVNTEDEARNYPVAPNTTVYLMNQNEPYFYAKSADSMGRTQFRKSKLVDETEPQRQKINLSEYIKREELDNLISDAVQREVEKRMSEISFKPTKRQKQVVADEED